MARNYKHIKLDEVDAAALGAPISGNEVRKVLEKVQGGLGSSVVQYIPTGLLVASSILARGSPLFT